MYDNTKSPTGRLDVSRPALQNVPVPNNGPHLLPAGPLIDLDMAAIEHRVLEFYVNKEGAQ